MELVLYYIKESRILLLSFLILIFILGVFAYITMRNFRQSSRIKVSFYGFFLGLKNTDIIKLSAVIIKIFLVIYALTITNQQIIFICLVMILILAIIYIILAPKKIINEIVSTLMQMVMIYFVYTINGYMSEIEFSYVILMIKVCLIVFTILFSTYFLLRSIGDIVDNRVNKEFEKNRKDLKDEK